MLNIITFLPHPVLHTCILHRHRNDEVDEDDENEENVDKMCSIFRYMY